MSKSIKMVSPTDSEKWVFITHESGWKNTKVYAKGKLIRAFENPDILKKVVMEEINDFGTMKFSLHPATLKPTLIINGEKFFAEKKKRESVKEMNGVIVLFSIVVFLNLLPFLMAMVQLNASEPSSDVLFIKMIAATTGFFVALYTATAILFARGVYFMYFLGSGFFFASTVWILYNVYQSSIEFGYVIVLIRIILLGILGIYFKRIVSIMKAPKKDEVSEVLDSDF